MMGLLQSKPSSVKTAIGRAGALRSCVRGTAAVLALTGGLLLPTVVAAAWYGADWPYRQKITILPTLADADLSAFPYLVKITDPANTVFGVAQTGSEDILFTEANGTSKLAHEVEKYNAATNELYIWVKIPTVSATVNTEIYMYYRDDGTGDEQDVNGVWSNGFQGVWHLEEASGDHLDSTVNGNTGTPQGTIHGATGQIDGAVQFVSSDYIDLQRPPSLDITGNITVSVWANVTGGANSQRPIVGKGDRQYMLRSGDNNRFEFFTHDGNWHEASANGTHTNGEWYYVVGRLIGTEVSVWVDGVQQDDKPSGGISSNSSDVEIGRNSDSTGRDFHGVIDEVRIATIARQPEWIMTEFRNQKTPATYQSLGEEETAGPKISGVVFEDVNYGGGDGRDFSTADTSAQVSGWGAGGIGSGAGVVVELYEDQSGNFIKIADTTTAANGSFSFSSLPDGTCRVRVVNGSVISSRGSNATGFTPLAVQIFRNDPDSGGPVVNEVGGSNPVAEDDGAQVDGTDLSTITAQSVSEIVVSGADVNNVDFGFNFDTIVNANGAGQGSLRQFLRNSNELDNANLDQDGLTTGVETSVFMIPSDSDPWGRAKDPKFDAGRGVATITLASILPPISDGATAIDGTTQTATVGDTNANSLGYVGTVGVGADGVPGTGDEPTLSGVARPEVEVVDGGGLAVGVDIQANNVTVRSIAVYGFGTTPLTANIRIGLGGSTNYTGTLIESNVIGTLATSFSDPGAGARTEMENIVSLGADGGTIRSNLIGYAGLSGIVVNEDDVGWTIQGNEIRGNAISVNDYEGIAIEMSSHDVSIIGNLIAENQGSGFDSWRGGGDNLIENNTFAQNGLGGQETQGVRLYGTGNIVQLNLIQNNVGAAVLVVGRQGALGGTPSTENRISKNSFSANGSNAIDLVVDGSADNDTGDGITLNDGTLLGDSSVANTCGTVATHGNEGLDAPIIDLVLLGGGGATVRGRSCPGAEVEIYRAVADGDGSDTSGSTDYGEGVAYLTTATAAAGTGLFEATGVAGLSAGDAVSAIAIDSDDNTSEFTGNAPAQALSIVKRAFQSDGTPIASSSTLPSGMPVKFVLYVDNPGPAVTDASLQDVLDPIFVYQGSSMKVDNTLVSSVVCPGGVCDEAAIFARVDGSGVALGDGDADTDAGSYTPGTRTIDLGDGNNPNNAPLDLDENSVWAVVFTIRMQ